MNTYLWREENDGVSQRTAQRCLYRQGYHRRVVRKKVRVREVNRKKRLNWCRGKMRWNVNGQWDKEIFSDESQVVLGANQRKLAAMSLR